MPLNTNDVVEHPRGSTAEWLVLCNFGCTGVIGLTSDQQVRIRTCAPSVGTPDQQSRGAARPVPEGVMGRSVRSLSLIHI